MSIQAKAARCRALLRSRLGRDDATALALAFFPWLVPVARPAVATRFPARLRSR